MKFKWCFREGRFGSDSAVRIFSINDNIQGLQIQNEKPNTVELDYEELCYLYNNREHLLTILVQLKK